MSTVGRVVVGAVLVSVLVACAPRAQGQPAADPQQVLAKAREATGLDPKRHGAGIQLTGTAEMLGEKHTVTILTDGSGNFLSELSGPFNLARCVTDGRAWMRDIGGEVRWLHLGEHDEAIIYALFVSGAWTTDPRLIFTLPTPAALEQDPDATLSFTLASDPLRGLVVIDPKTSRATRIKFHPNFSGDGPADVLTLSGTVNHAGATFPADIVLNNANGGSASVHLTTAEEMPNFIRSPYQPLFHTGDVTFDKSIPPQLEIKRAKTGHLLCRPTINGKQFDWFFFDTGAGSAVITPDVVDALSMERFGHVPVTGIGDSLTSNFVRAKTITLGPVTMQDAIMTQLDLSFVATAIGEKISGIIGYNLLARCIAEIDQKGGTVSLYDPAAYPPESQAEPKWTTLYTYERHPCVEASFEGHTGFFKLDTGAAGTTVSIHAPAVQRFKLLEGREIREARIGGVGGVRSAKKGTLAWFELGGHRTQNVEAMFATESKGALDDPYTLGNIGGDLMNPFVLVLDYQKERIAFKSREP